MAAMVCLVGMTKDAGATVTFTMVWTSTTGTGVVGTNSIFADAGDTLELNIVMTTDQRLGGHGVSLNFTDLANELNFAGAGSGRDHLARARMLPTTPRSLADLAARLKARVP
jgi:hypothetical protein